MLVLGGMLIVGINQATAEENGAYFEVEIVDHPDEVELGEEFDVEYYIENTGDLPGEQEVFVYAEAEVAGQKIWSESESQEVILIPNQGENYTHTTDTSEIEEEYDDGFFEIEVDVNILIESENDDDEATITFILPGLIPGFTFILLLLGITFAVIIYHTKKR